MKRLILAVVATAALSLPLPAQPAGPPLPETKVVLRVSRDFIYRLTGVRFHRDEPIRMNSAGNVITGDAHVDGRFDVKIHESDTTSNFSLLITGDIQTQMTATRRPVRVCAHGEAPFQATREVQFDGSTFTGQSVQMRVSHHSTIDQINSFRGGLIGALTRRLARPAVYRNMAEGDRAADDEIRVQVSNAIVEETDRLLAVINKVGPLAKKAEELMIAEDLIPKSGVQLYRAATKESLLFSTGPPDHRIAPLPERDAKRAPLELWIARREARKEFRLKFFLENWEMIVPIVEQQIARRYPDLVKSNEGTLQKVLKNMHMESVEDWHVIMFCPRLNDLLAIEPPPAG